MRWPWSAPAAADLECPECHWWDAVPVRVIERSRIEGGVVVSRVVGKVYRCAKCVTEYIAGPSGVYRPQVGGRPQPELDGVTKKPPRGDEPLNLRDSDQPWEAKRRR